MYAAPKLPEANVYELEYVYWPWGELIAGLTDRIKITLPNGVSVCDYMCGTGYLLNAISRERPDLRLAGCSLDSDYISYGKKKYPHIPIETADALTWSPPVRSDAIICTAGLHHLTRQDQPKFIAKAASELDSGGYFFLGEELIGPYETELERKSAIQNLSSRLTRYLTDKRAPNEVLQAASDVFNNDLLERGEYKVSYHEIIRMLEQNFWIASVEHFWPTGEPLIGDFLFICRKK